MDEKSLHDLAVAYAQVKLLNFQKEYGKSGDTEELREFARAYNFCLFNFEKEYESLD